MTEPRKTYPEDYGTEAIIAYESCGCTIAITVLTGFEVDAYRSAAKWAKEGKRTKTVNLGVWKEGGSHCADHPKGPPWWKSRGGDGKPPTEAPTKEMGL